MCPHAIDVHPWSPDTPLLVHFPDLLVKLLEFFLLVFSIGQMRVGFGFIEAHKLWRLDDCTETDSASDLMSEAVAVMIHLCSKVLHFQDDVANRLRITQVVYSHAHDDVTWLWVVLVASPPGSAAIPDSPSHYHLTVEVQVSLERGMSPEASKGGG